MERVPGLAFVGINATQSIMVSYHGYVKIATQCQVWSRMTLEVAMADMWTRAEDVDGRLYYLSKASKVLTWSDPKDWVRFRP